MAALFNAFSVRGCSFPTPFTSALFCCSTIQFQATPLLCISALFHCGSSLLLSFTSLFNALAPHFDSFHCHSFSMPLRLLTVLFQYQAFLSYFTAFHSHSLAPLLLALPFLRISVLFFSIASPLPTVLVLIRSARFCCYALLICSMPTHYISLLCLSKPSYAFSFLRFSLLLHTSAKPNISLPNLTFPLQCISFLFHCRSWLINAVTSLCSALLNVTLPSHSNAIPMRIQAIPFHCLADQITAIT